MTNKECSTVIKNVLNSLGDIEIKAKYAKIYTDCFDALAVIMNDLNNREESLNAVTDKQNT